MKAAFYVIMCGILLSGCEKKRTEISEKAGEAVGEHLTEFTRALGKGVDNSLMVKVTLSPEVKALGLEHTTAKAIGMESAQKGFTIYLIASKDVDSSLMARAFNVDKAEIGRAKLALKMAKDEAGYFKFEFPKEMDSMTVKEFTIGL